MKLDKMVSPSFSIYLGPIVPISEPSVWFMDVHH